MKKGDVKRGVNGKSYILQKKLGRGGQAEVWKVLCQEDNIEYAYKQYKHNTNNIRANIEALIKIGKFKDKDGNILDSVVLPITTVNCTGDSFGYVMELVNLQDYTTVKKAWCGTYPSCEALCKIVQNFATVFKTLHESYGMCYKDVNEGNIFFNPSTGSIKIIDNDNIGYAEKFTIKGTSGYMAPEVILGAKPDYSSDRFSFAVFVYRLLVGGYPFEGPYTEQYCVQHNVLPDDARKVIFGTHALFVWHPTDTRNSIEKSKDPRAKGQAGYWKKLPQQIKDLFIKTFVTNLPKERRAERSTDVDWYETFVKIEKNLVKCPKCGVMTFSEEGRCFECSAILNRNAFLPISSKFKKPTTPQSQSKKTGTTQVIQSGTTSKPQVQRHGVVFKVLSAGETKHEMTVYVSTKTATKGTDVSKHLPASNLFQILYNKNAQKVGIKNLSPISWTIVRADDTKSICASGDVQVLEVGMKIRIIPRTAQLNVEKIIG